MRRILLLLLSVFLLVGGRGAYARDNNLILSQSYFEDKTNALTFAQIQKEPFTPYQGVLSGGYKGSSYWIKLRLPATDEQTVIKIRPPYNEEIEIFDPASPVSRPLIGAKHPWHANAVEGLSFNFQLPAYTNERDVYLRIKSARAYMVYVEAMSLADFQRIDRQDQWIAVAYTVFTFILAAGLFLVWLINRESVLGVFTIQQCLAFLHAFFHVGLGAMWLDSFYSATTINYVWCLVVVIYPLVAFIANKLLLAEYGLKNAYKKTCNVLIGMSLLVIAIFLAGEPLALKLNASLVLVVMLFFAVAAWCGLNPDRSTFKSVALPVATLRAYYTFNILIWTATMVPMLGLHSFGEVPLYTIMIYNILSGVVFFFVLQYRARALQKIETERSTILEFEARQERKQREEQGMLMAMLSHEIKTPLSILKLVVDEKVVGSDLEAHANRAMSNINAIINRCVQLDKLDANKIKLNNTRFECQEFIDTLLQDYVAKDRVQIQTSESVMVYADREVLGVVVGNLLENALKYGAQGKPVHVELSSIDRGDQPGTRITIRNSTGSLGAPDPAYVFKKYYRNIQATKITGSGLGLFLVQELMGVMGGEATYTAEPEEVAFSIWIPA